MGCWGELKSLRAQSVGEVSGYQSCAKFVRMCGKESEPGLQLLEKLVLSCRFSSVEMLVGIKTKLNTRLAIKQRADLFLPGVLKTGCLKS